MEKYKHLIDKKEYDELDILEKLSSSASASGLDNPQASQISNMLNDKYFEMFSNTVKHNPGQVLRYDLGGKPLLYSGKDDVAKNFWHNQQTFLDQVSIRLVNVDLNYN